MDSVTGNTYSKRNISLNGFMLIYSEISNIILRIDLWKKFSGGLTENFSLCRQPRLH